MEQHTAQTEPKRGCCVWEKVQQLRIHPSQQTQTHTNAHEAVN